MHYFKPFELNNMKLLPTIIALVLIVIAIEIYNDYYLILLQLLQTMMKHFCYFTMHNKAFARNNLH